MFGIGTPELIIIAVIIFILFGAKKIPDIGKGLGGAIREFRNIKKEISGSPEKEPSEKKDKEETTDLLEEGIKKQVLNHVPGVRKAMEISDKVKKVNEIIK